jgi:hypothetical protein
MIVGATMSKWTEFYTKMRSSLDSSYLSTTNPVQFEGLNEKATETRYYADLRPADRREMSKYSEYTEHVTHFTPCMQSNPENNVSMSRSLSYITTIPNVIRQMSTQ